MDHPANCYNSTNDYLNILFFIILLNKFYILLVLQNDLVRLVNLSLWHPEKSINLFTKTPG